MKKIRITATVLCIVTMMLMLTPLCSNAIEQPDIKYTSHCCIISADSGEVLFEKGSDEKVAPAGTVKMMTGLIALEHYGENINTTVTVSADAITDTNGNTCGLNGGDSVTASDLLAALIIGNYNDSALALAIDVAGNIPAFVDMMNAKAAELGMNNTHYLNPVGYDEVGMYTTAADVCILGRAITANQSYIKFSDSPSYIPDTIGENLIIYNRNYFISTYYNLCYYRDSAIGLNSGYTDSIGQCVCVADKGSHGFTFITAVMGASEPEELPFAACNTTYEDAETLTKWASSGFDLFTVVDTDDMICEVPVKLSEGTDHVILLPKTKLNVMFPSDTDIDDEISFEWELKDTELVAPISEGSYVGDLKVYSKTRGFIGEVELVAKNNVDRSPWLFFLECAKEFLSNPVILIVIIFAVLVIVAAIILLSIYISRKNRPVRYRTSKDK